MAGCHDLIFIRSPSLNSVTRIVRCCHRLRLIFSCGSPAHSPLPLPVPTRSFAVATGCCSELAAGVCVILWRFFAAVNPFSSGIARLRSSLNIWCNEKRVRVFCQKNRRRAMPEKWCNESKAPQKTVWGEKKTKSHDGLDYMTSVSVPSYYLLLVTYMIFRWQYFMADLRERDGCGAT